jgi:hypothetical protein
LSVERDRKKRLLKVHQGNHVEELLNRFKMEDCVPRSVPWTSGTVLVKKGKTLGHEVPFGSLVGALMYLATCTRPDIAYVVGQLSRYMAAPTVEHWTIAKGVLRYLKGTIHRGLVYGVNVIVCGYADAHFAAATSTCEAEYMAAGTAVREALWLH